MSTFALLANHLWQSTVFAALIGLVALACRRNQASLRHALWLAASIKFLIPFAPLVALGAQLAPATLERLAPPAALAVAIDSASQPFATPTSASPASRAATPSSSPARSAISASASAVLATIWGGGTLLVLGIWGLRWRRVDALARRGPRLTDGAEVDTLRRLERQAGLRTALSIVEAPASCEPGIFGIVTPVLLWPAGIREHLTADQLRAILAHEVAHARRRDNLTAALQAVVEAIFWFHPLVWWIGARLVDERERACDEEVLRTGGEPQLYAETILLACRLYLQAPPSCVAGVASSNLRTRIERIMTSPTARTLTRGRKLALTACAAVVIATPVAVGALTASPRLRVPSAPGVDASGALRPAFEAASVTLNPSGDGRMSIAVQPGGRVNATNVTLRTLIQTAYRVQPAQIVGAPGWFTTTRFDIIAKGAAQDDEHEPLAAIAPGERGEPGAMLMMLQSLLADRFKLEVRRETRDQPIYALKVARPDGTLGPQLQRSDIDCTIRDDKGGLMFAKKAFDDPAVAPPCGIRLGIGLMSIGGTRLAQLAASLSALLDRPVFDRTNLPGSFNASLTWTPDKSTPDKGTPSLFTAIQEQLGLTLEATRAPVDVLVIVSAQPPTR
jgi:bla regulator protein blaR1